MKSSEDYQMLRNQPIATAASGRRNERKLASSTKHSQPEWIVRPVHNLSERRALSWQELKEQAILAYESGLLPRSLDSRQKAVTIALMGSELGLSPMQALCGIYVVNGMTALRGSLMLRLIYERISGARITVLTPPEKADEECTVEMQRPNGKPHTFRFTLEDAKKAGFMSKLVWQQHTSSMLRWAAIRSGARVVFADAIAGCYMEDEIPDLAVATPPSGAEVRHPDTSPDVEAKAVAASISKAPESEVAQNLPASDQAASSEAATISPSEVSPWRVPRLELRDLVRAQADRKITDKQVKRLYAIANEKKWSRPRMAAWMADWFGKKEPKDLNREEYDRLCNHILASKPEEAAS